MEEAYELCLELGRTDVEPDRVAAEAADLESEEVRYGRHEHRPA